MFVGHVYGGLLAAKVRLTTRTMSLSTLTIIGTIVIT